MYGTILRPGNPLRCRGCPPKTGRGHPRLQLGFVLRPCNDIAVTPDRTVALGMRFIEVEVDPLLVDCVGPAVLREGIHIPGRAFELAKCFVVVVQKNVLVVEVRTVEQ